MRSFPDRIRHAVSFEVIALLLMIPLGSLLFHLPAGDIGVVGIVSATAAMLWNMVFNHLFDLAMKRLRGTTQKTGALRILHAVSFELGLLALLLPFVAWYLGMTLWQALVLDLAVAGFYMVFGLVFNWAYDRIFPLPEWSAAD